MRSYQSARNLRTSATDLVRTLDRLAAAMIGEDRIAYSSAVQPAWLMLEADPDLIERYRFDRAMTALSYENASWHRLLTDVDVEGMRLEDYAERMQIDLSTASSSTWAERASTSQ